ncbi:MAG: hypothetical protein PVG24_02740 [Gammaproteobacteria bacterium]|jgi:hypothetical protein
MDKNKIIAARVTLALVAAALAPVAATAQGNTIVFDNVGGWTVRTDPAREYRCFIEADYDNGSSVRAGFNTDSGRFYITVADYRWDWVELGAPYVVSLQFDDEPALEFDATGVVLETDYIQPGLELVLPQELEDGIVAQFMYLTEMQLRHADGAELTLGLFGTQRAVESLEGCQIKMAQTAQSTEFSALQ